nr:carbamoyltransferase HypF [Bacillus marinisedimentorum]
MRKALSIVVKGKVQGVGFRPFIYSLSKKYGLDGTVQNNLGCVTITVEGDEDRLDSMVKELEASPPVLAKIDEVKITHIPPSGSRGFAIIPSLHEGDAVPMVPADAAVCRDCLREMNDPADRRFGYPFINCTQCGPRYTIIEKLPYDRSYTTMREFTMCPECREEYEDPADRRHHAQPTCCPKCGPTVKLLDRNGENLAENSTALAQTGDFLKQGFIIAIKGVGGYHLACDARQKQAVEQLRLLKKRPQRPLAVMVKSLDAAAAFCQFSEEEKRFLTGPEMPIAVLRKKRECPLPDAISPGLSTIGVMLPYTPLHHLLFEKSGLDCLVMTSANLSGMPIHYRDGISDVLGGLCNYVLTHDREIHLPIDDSVVQSDRKDLMMLRRARGFTPEPLKTKADVDNMIALGGNQKNTFSIGREHHIFMSPHIGDLENEEMIRSFEEQLAHYKKWLDVREVHVAIDKHPLYATTAIAERMGANIIPVQHHHAHHVSCMADNGLEEPCLGIILDGTGYGEDGTIWGFEFLYGDAGGFERLACLRPAPLPGGETAVKEPWRAAVGMLLHFWPEEGEEWANALFPEKKAQIRTLQQMIKTGLNSPMAGTAGRLFDAVSALLGVCKVSTYEGEAAVKLSDFMNGAEPERQEAAVYPFRLGTERGSPVQLDLSPMIRQIIADHLGGVPSSTIIRKFHETIVASCIDVVRALMNQRPGLNRTIVLSGGSFQNAYLAREVHRRLGQEGFGAFTHQNVPCHDGGLSLGQLIIASVKKGGA